MSDKQTTAIILIVLVAFLFWLYNQKTKTGTKLSDAIAIVTGNVPAATTSSSTGSSTGLTNVTNSSLTLGSLPSELATDGLFSATTTTNALTGTNPLNGISVPSTTDPTSITGGYFA